VYNWHTELTGIKTESMLLIQYLIHVFEHDKIQDIGTENLVLKVM